MAGPKVFISYSHQDGGEFVTGIKGHLDALEKGRKIQSWSDRDVNAGANWAEEIKVNLEAADVIIFFLSPAWFSSDNCDDEYKAAQEREQRGEARIIPFLVRHMDYYTGTHFANRNPLPKKADRPHAVELWDPHFNLAYTELISELVRVADAMRDGRAEEGAEPDVPPESAADVELVDEPRHPTVRRRHGIPLTAQHFIGREPLIEALKTDLHAAADRPFVALIGQPGFGKTAMAAEYARRYAADYDVVAWLRGDSEEHLMREYSSLARALGLAATDKAARDAVRKWLSEHGRWLVVLDNAIAPGDLDGFLPEAWPGHLVVTSRTPGWHSLGPELEVHELELVDAAGYLMSSTGSNDMKAAVALAELVDRVPLQLVLAAKKVKADGVRLHEYAARLRAREEHGR